MSHADAFSSMTPSTTKVPESARWPAITAVQAAVWRECRCFTLTSNPDRLRNPHGWPASRFTRQQLTYPGRVASRWSVLLGGGGGSSEMV